MPPVRLDRAHRQKPGLARIIHVKTRIFITLWSLALLIGALVLGDGMGALAGLVAIALVAADLYERRDRGSAFGEEHRREW